MIDFELTETHRHVEELVADFGPKHVLPNLKENDRAHRYDPDLLGHLAKADLLGICIPEKYGGAGLDYISLGLACEGLEYFDTAARVALSVHVGLMSMTLLSYGTEEQKQKYLPDLAHGRRIGTFGLTEPNAGSDVVGIQTTAVRDGDEFILNGEKMWISLADVADTFTVYGWTDREKKVRRDHSGISAFMVERGAEGLTTGSIKGKLGVRTGNTGFIHMHDVRVPAANMLGKEGDGFKIAMFALEQGRYTVASGATGLVKACRDTCVEYSKTRKTFGQPLSQHQLVKQMIAYMERDYQASRLLYLRAGWLKNRGERSSRETALAKWFACDVAEKAASDAVQVHGAYGFSDEYPVERFYRNAKGSNIYEGTREMQTLIQADYALGIRVDKPRLVELPKAEQDHEHNW
jgi:glutaryl-CoA dehydrogenase (non-decarboxylating)